MESIPEAGSIVRSIKGRDYGTVYLVVSVTHGQRGPVCLTANGLERKLDRLKAKNPRHLQLLCEKPVLFDPAALTDAALRKLLEAYRTEN